MESLEKFTSALYALGVCVVLVITGMSVQSIFNMMFDYPYSYITSTISSGLYKFKRYFWDNALGIYEDTDIAASLMLSSVLGTVGGDIWPELEEITHTVGSGVVLGYTARIIGSNIEKAINSLRQIYLIYYIDLYAVEVRLYEELTNNFLLREEITKSSLEFIESDNFIDFITTGVRDSFVGPGYVLFEENYGRVTSSLYYDFMEKDWGLLKRNVALYVTEYSEGEIRNYLSRVDKIEFGDVTSSISGLDQSTRGLMYYVYKEELSKQIMDDIWQRLGEEFAQNKRLKEKIQNALRYVICGPEKFEKCKKYEEFLEEFKDQLDTKIDDLLRKNPDEFAEELEKWMREEVERIKQETLDVLTGRKAIESYYESLCTVAEWEVTPEVRSKLDNLFSLDNNMFYAEFKQNVDNFLTKTEYQAAREVIEGALEDIEGRFPTALEDIMNKHAELLDRRAKTLETLADYIEEGKIKGVSNFDDFLTGIARGIDNPELRAKTIFSLFAPPDIPLPYSKALTETFEDLTRKIEKGEARTIDDIAMYLGKEFKQIEERAREELIYEIDELARKRNIIPKKSIEKIVDEDVSEALSKYFVYKNVVKKYGAFEVGEAIAKKGMSEVTENVINSISRRSIIKEVGIMGKLKRLYEIGAKISLLFASSKTPAGFALKSIFSIMYYGTSKIPGATRAGSKLKAIASKIKGILESIKNKVKFNFKRIFSIFKSAAEKGKTASEAVEDVKEGMEVAGEVVDKIGIGFIIKQVWKIIRMEIMLMLAASIPVTPTVSQVVRPFSSYAELSKDKFSCSLSAMLLYISKKFLHLSSDPLYKTMNPILVADIDAKFNESFKLKEVYEHLLKGDICPGVLPFRTEEGLIGKVIYPILSPKYRLTSMGIQSLIMEGIGKTTGLASEREIEEALFRTYFRCKVPYIDPATGKINYTWLDEDKCLEMLIIPNLTYKVYIEYFDFQYYPPSIFSQAGLVQAILYSMAYSFLSKRLLEFFRAWRRGEEIPIKPTRTIDMAISQALVAAATYQIAAQRPINYRDVPECGLKIRDLEKMNLKLNKLSNVVMRFLSQFLGTGIDVWSVFMSVSTGGILTAEKPNGVLICIHFPEEYIEKYQEYIQNRLTGGSPLLVKMA